MRKKIVLLFLIVPFIFVSCGNSKNKEINISVAASLYNPISKILENYEIENNVKININSGGSGTLKKQISNGAEVGVFISADEEYVNELINEGLVSEENKNNKITNTLVVIKNKEASGEKLALGEVSTVPAGKYGKEFLKKIGEWENVKDNTIYCKDVTAVKSYVESGEVDYGIVYKSDAIDLKNSTLIKEIPENLHSKIVYSMATIEGNYDEEEKNKIVEYILSSKGIKILKEYGFRIEE